MDRPQEGRRWRASSRPSHPRRLLQQKPIRSSPTQLACIVMISLMGLASSSVSAAAGNRESGIITSQIQIQPRQPMPPYKLRMLFDLEETDEVGRRRLADPDGALPLHAGYGTHYAFLYVGTPPQRVSVILDTGSHWTAFPCTGCKQCGTQHTDPVFDVEKSSTSHALACSECQFSGQCRDNQCSISLSYAEGSRWDAYEVKDVVYLGGDSVSEVVLGGASLGMPFVFGCQTYETGLFRTQLENGIMGLSFQDLTIVPKLKENNKINHLAFSLCFTTEGGSMRLGGYETAHHTSPIQFLPLTKPTGWYTVKLLDVKIGGKSIGIDADEYNKGQGTIVDSGTTDTYLPRTMATNFQQVFREVSGTSYSTRLMRLSQEEFKALPDIVFVFENGVEASMPWSSYIECSDGNCAGAVFLDNGNGVVLGANFMKGKDIAFDLENKQLGIAPANCDYVAPGSAPPAAAAAAVEAKPDGGAAAVSTSTTEGGNKNPAEEPEKDSEDVDCALTFGAAAGNCTAVCPKGERGVASGEQPWTMVVGTPPKGKGKACTSMDPAPIANRPCMVNCDGPEDGAAGAEAPAVPQKPKGDKPVVEAEPEVASSTASTTSSVAAAATHCHTDPAVWSACTEACEQEAEGEVLQPDGSCKASKLKRACSTGSLCSLSKEGFVVDLAVLLHGLTGQGGGRTLSKSSQEKILSEVSYLLAIPAGDIETMTPAKDVAAAAKSEDAATLGLRLHFITNSSATYTVGNKLSSPAEKAAEVNATVQAPPFSLALLTKLKDAGEPFVSLKSIELASSHVEDLGYGSSTEEPAAVFDDTKELNIFLWDVVGGSAAVFIVLMLLVHFRWSYWQSLSQAPSGSLFQRIRQGRADGAGGSIGGLKRPTKPNSRSYELVEEEQGRAAAAAGAGGGAEEEEDIEMM